MDEKESNRMIRKKIFENIIIAIAIMIYYMVVNFASMKVSEEIFLQGLKIASIIILALSIGIIEIAYNKDSGKIAIYGMEILVLAIHTLTTWNLIKKYNVSFEVYVLVSTYVFAIYYIFKSIIIYTNERRKFANSLSDIHEIVKKEPLKKEAKKRES